MGLIKIGFSYKISDTSGMPKRGNALESANTSAAENAKNVRIPRALQSSEQLTPNDEKITGDRK